MAKVVFPRTYAVPSDEIRQAYRVWFMAHSGTINVAMDDFQKLTGIGTFLGRSPYLLGEKEARIIRLLAGPHGHAVAKAHMATEAEEITHGPA